MKKFLKGTIFYFWQFTWGILQNLIGFFAFVWFGLIKGMFHCMYRGAFITLVPNNRGSISLGCFIFIATDNENLIKHEYGHTIQTAILGPLWLFIIGLPSITWANLFQGYRKKNNVSYFSFYTEKWANKLVGIDLK